MELVIQRRHAAPAGAMRAGGLDRLVSVLRERGYEVIAPVLRDGALALAPIASAAEIARGWRDHQEAGTWRLEPDPRQLYFGVVNGAHSWKEILFPPRVVLWRGRRGIPSGDGGVDAPVVTQVERTSQARALLGVRACDLEAIAVQDRVLLGGEFVDADYRERRASTLLVAVNCGRAAPTCFCVSAGAGPRAQVGFDLALTEIIDGRGHWFWVEVGTAAGAEVAAELDLDSPLAAGERAAKAVVSAARVQERRLPPGIRDLLAASSGEPMWERIAERCLSCGNCTMVCPTCFCVSIEEGCDLSLEAVDRSRRWESCFSGAHSHIHGGSVHRSTASRYRQWMTHKLSTWWDQFGTSGCVGCGRCVTWCPVAIDITEEAGALASKEPWPC